MLHWSWTLSLLCAQKMAVGPGGSLSVGQRYPQPHSPRSHSFASCSLIHAAMWLKINPFGRHLLSLRFTPSAFSSRRHCCNERFLCRSQWQAFLKDGPSPPNVCDTSPSGQWHVLHCFHLQGHPIEPLHCNCQRNCLIPPGPPPTDS